MNEWFKKTFGTIKEKWAKWSLVQKGILIGIVVVVIAAIIALISFSSKPSTVALWSSPVTDEFQRSAIVTRLEQENVKVYVSQNGIISVQNETIAKHWRPTLVAEGLEPSRKDPGTLFSENSKNWSRTAFDDNVTWLRALEGSVEKQIKQLDGVQTVNVVLAIPQEKLLLSEQNPVSASVVIRPKMGSDILESKTRIKSVQHLIMRCVEGLSEDNITIVNGITNTEVNDFASMEELDRLTNLQKQQRIVRSWETEYQSAVLNALRSTFGDERVRVSTLKVEMDFSTKTMHSKHYGGIQLKQDDPKTPYDDGITVEKLPISEETVEKSFTGTGYNPEGPAGQEGQNPPVYDDMSNVVGKSTESGVKRNYALNEDIIDETVEPIPGRRTISVNIDGEWNYPLYDPDTHKVRLSESGGYERQYVPIPDEIMAKVEKLVRGAVGYDSLRGDEVYVTNVPFDRKDQFRAEDERFIKSQRTKHTLLMVLIGIAVVLIVFIAFRLISRELERRRRRREEEQLRRQQEERERALWDAKDQGLEVTMSVEERKRAELQENAIAMAKEHPEDVAMLIRTWLMEE